MHTHCNFGLPFKLQQSCSRCGRLGCLGPCCQSSPLLQRWWQLQKRLSIFWNRLPACWLRTMQVWTDVWPVHPPCAWLPDSLHASSAALLMLAAVASG